MASPSIRPHMLVADEQGNIYDHPDFLLLCRRGEEWSLPRPDELPSDVHTRSSFCCPDAGPWA